MKLAATQAKQAKSKDKSYKLADGHGMYLLVNPNGSKYWRLKYRYGGKEKVLALGVYPKTSLTGARDKRDEAKQLLAKDMDPGVVKRRNKQARNEAGANSFKVIATEWHKIRMVVAPACARRRTPRRVRSDRTSGTGSRPRGLPRTRGGFACPPSAAPRRSGTPRRRSQVRKESSSSCQRWRPIDSSRQRLR